MNDQYNELYEKLTRIQQLLRRYHHINQANHGPMANPTCGQGRVIALLKIQPEISTKELSYLLGIRQQSLNELLNKLEKGGFVVREPAESDRRVMMVKLTEKGQAEQQTEPDASDIFTCLGEEEQDAFAGYLDRVIAKLEGMPGIEECEQEDDWIEATRSRMGEEQFERLMARRGGMGYGHHGSRKRHGDREDCPLGRHANRRRNHSRMEECIFN